MMMRDGNGSVLRVENAANSLNATDRHDDSYDRRRSLRKDKYHIEILKSLRVLDNRLCSDCNFPICNMKEGLVYGSCTFGVWLCNKCAEVHLSLGNEFANIKRSTSDDWTAEDVKIMTSSSNVNINKVMERYIPPGWTKCTPTAKQSERLLWIKAKYESRLFMIPSNTTPNAKNVKKPASVSAGLLPSRLIDYFCCVSLHNCLDYGIDFKNMHVEQISFSSKVTSRYPDSLPETVLPNHLGAFVFPDGVHLASTDKPPFYFNFVLTNELGIKLFGGCLRIYEIMELEELAILLGNDINSDKLPKVNIVYAPKSLVILSHYPFFNLFRHLLEQTYRISLSSSPLPLERYIENFCVEIPLPPLGVSEVVFSLADRTITISRPQKNQLPMIDISYRPLFTCLSIDNIMVLFAFLCCESKICLCSSNISLLTVIEEALLSFLFPLVWQGAYIPVLPQTMLDILDAPVPYLVGVKREYLLIAGELVSIDGVVLVDIDCNQVHLGKTVEPISLPAREGQKLRSKLVEFGHCAFRSSYMEYVQSCGIVFPSGEHLIPITQFAVDDGVTISHNTRFANGHITSSDKERNSILNVPIQASKANSNLLNNLDPGNNIGQDGFDAREIRYEFLRFFLSIFRDLHEFIDYSDQRQSGIKENNQLQFKKTEFLNGHKGLFFKLLTETQMFSKFVEEINSDQNEVRFFQESITEKLNRSSTKVTKRPTPFLDDQSEEICATHIPPLPSNWGIPPGKKFTYTKFPSLIESNFCPPRTARLLVKKREVGRLLNAAAQATVLSLSEEKLIEQSQQSFASDDVATILMEAKNRYHRIITALTKLKNKFKARPIRWLYLRYRNAALVIQRHFRKWQYKKLCVKYNLRQKTMIWRIQKFFRRNYWFSCCKKFRRASIIQKYFRRHLAILKFRKLKRAAVIIQMYIRRHQALNLKIKLLAAAVRIQTFFRCRLNVNNFQKRRIMAIKIQAVVRQRLQQKKHCMNCLDYLSRSRRVLFELWKIVHYGLEKRTCLWLGTKPSSQGISQVIKRWVVQEEIVNICNALKITAAVFTNCAHCPWPNKLTALEQYVQRGFLRPPAQIAHAEEEERAHLYKIMKADDAMNKDVHFQAFGILNQKKRKRTLVSLIWNDFAKADESASATAAILSISTVNIADDQHLVNMMNAIKGKIYASISLSTFIALQQEADRLKLLKARVVVARK